MQATDSDIETCVVAGLKNGDRKMYNQIFDQYYSRIRYFAYKLTGSQEDSEDVTLESFAKLFAKNTDFNTVASIQAFLYIATRNACFNLLKYQHKVRAGNKEVLHLAGGESDPDPDPAIVESELIRMLYEAIESLPPERKKVFKLLYIDGLKIAEVAAQLNISPHTVKSHRAKAIIALRKTVPGRQLVVLWLLWRGL